MKVWWEKSGPAAAAAAQITVAVSKDELTYMAWKESWQVKGRQREKVSLSVHC
jgi:hypothetical protein